MTDGIGISQESTVLVPSAPDDPSISQFTRRFAALDDRLEAKHKKADEALLDSKLAIQGFKQVTADSRTRMSIKAFTPEDLGEAELDTEDESPEDEDAIKQRAS